METVADHRDIFPSKEVNTQTFYDGKIIYIDIDKNYHEWYFLKTPAACLKGN